LTVEEAIEVQVADAPDVDLRDVPSPELMRRWAQAALGASQGRGLCIRVVGREEGRFLNASYRESDRATNVLAFPAGGTLDTEIDLLGDIAICAPVVREEAPEQSMRQRHWAHMVVHGVLHLLGHDHRYEDEAQWMESCEEAILSDLGFPGDAHEQ
jgi:probable rRNA maturation factor